MSKFSVLSARIGCILFVVASSALAASPKNVIFMVGDGMGFNHVRAAAYYLGTNLCFESLPYQAQVMTYSANDSITDSAAAATAMATGTKVNNGVISVATPGNGANLLTLLELYKARGARTGLVTSDAMTGATPAAFGAHDPDRNNTSQIAGDYLSGSRPNLLLGGGGVGMTTAAALTAGYTVVTNYAELQAINTGTVAMLSGQFGTTGPMPYEYDGLGNLPHLSQIIVTALNIVSNDPDGFFLLVEGGNIDHGAHANDIARTVRETVEFHNTVQVAMNWVAGRNDTLLIVTADHETGGMTTPQNNGVGNYPTVSWTTGGHTSTNVGAWATGVNAQYINGIINNTQYFQWIAGSDPFIKVTPTSLPQTVAWGVDPAPGTTSFTIQNIGMGTFDYTITSNATWVAPSTTSGSCTMETDTIGLVFTTASLAPGPYVATLTVASGQATNSPQTVTVNLTVDPAPGDFDGDQDVDQEDFGHLQACLTESGMLDGCTNADFNHSGSVNQTDITVFTNCMRGPNVAPISGCGG